MFACMTFKRKAEVNGILLLIYNPKELHSFLGRPSSAGKPSKPRVFLCQQNITMIKLLPTGAYPLCSIPQRKRKQTRFYNRIVARHQKTSIAEPTQQDIPINTPKITHLHVVTIFQSLALVGAVVGGIVARQRRKQLGVLNSQLRQINAQLRARSDEQQQAMNPSSSFPQLSLRTTLERSLSQPSAAHPIEQISSSSPSMARARQFINETISLGKRTVGHPSSSSKSPVDKITPEFLEMLEDALATSNNIQDVQSASYLLRIKARAHLALGTRGDLQEAMMNLKEAAAVLLRNNTNANTNDDNINNSRDIKEDGDVLDIQDVYGELGDVFTDLGNYEEAARYYGLALSMDYNT
jgi:hypothetical protein